MSYLYKRSNWLWHYLIRYRLKNERSIERIYDQPVDTEFGGSGNERDDI